MKSDLRKSQERKDAAEYAYDYARNGIRRTDESEYQHRVLLGQFVLVLW